MSNLESNLKSAPVIQPKPLPVVVTFIEPEREIVQSREYTLHLHSERLRMNKFVMWAVNQGIQFTVTPSN